MATILLIEDNEHIIHINEAALTMRDYTVLCADSLQKAQNLLSFHQVDLIILDIMLPDGNGIEFCKKLKMNSKVPVLFLSALGESEDIVAGLRAGGDDYLAKPYDLEVLIARVEARLRTQAIQNRFIQVGNLKLDTISLSAYVNDQDLLLTKKEFSVLLLLAQKANRVVDKQLIYQSIWGVPMNSDSRALWTIISRLKKKLKLENANVTISSQRSEGYMLEL